MEAVVTDFPAPDDEQNFHNHDCDRSHHSFVLSYSHSQTMLHLIAGILVRMLQGRAELQLTTFITMVEGALLSHYNRAWGVGIMPDRVIIPILERPTNTRITAVHCLMTSAHGKPKRSWKSVLPCSLLSDS